MRLQTTSESWRISCRGITVQEFMRLQRRTRSKARQAPTYFGCVAPNPLCNRVLCVSAPHRHDAEEGDHDMMLAPISLDCGLDGFQSHQCVAGRVPRGGAPTGTGPRTRCSRRP